MEDNKLAREVQEDLKHANLSTISFKLLTSQLEERLGMDLSGKKAFIKECLMNFIDLQASKTGSDSEDSDEEENDGAHEIKGKRLGNKSESKSNSEIPAKLKRSKLVIFLVVCCCFIGFHFHILLSKSTTPIISLSGSVMTFILHHFHLSNLFIHSQRVGFRSQWFCPPN